MTSGASTPIPAPIPVGYVRSARSDPSDVGWGDVVARIELDPERFGPEALSGLEEFSHVEIVFFFHELPAESVEFGTRHPRGDARWPRIGIFAQRAAGRPNRIGVSRARVMRVEGRALEVEGLDAINGTPVLDIKPYMREFGPAGEVRQPWWCAEVMAGYYFSQDDAGR